MLEKLPPEITETEAGPTRQFAPVAPGGTLTEELPKVESTFVLDAAIWERTNWGVWFFPFLFVSQRTPSGK